MVNINANMAAPNCFKPVSLQNLENNELYVVYGIHKTVKTYNTSTSNDINDIKNDNASIFNTTYINLGNYKKSSPSVIVFCKVSAITKDNVQYDNTKDRDDYNIKYSKVFTEDANPFNTTNKENNGDGAIPTTYTKTYDDGYMVYKYNYYYIIVSDDYIYRYVKNADSIDKVYNKACINDLSKVINCFTKDMLMYFYKYLCDINAIKESYMPYIDMSKFFIEKCQQDLCLDCTSNISQQEYINKVKWYYDILHNGYMADYKKEIQLKTANNIKNTIAEQVEIGTITHYDIDMSLTSVSQMPSKKLDLSNLEFGFPKDHPNRISRYVINKYTHSIGPAKFKFHISDILGFKLKKQSHSNIIPYFKCDKDRVLAVHYNMFSPKEYDYSKSNTEYISTYPYNITNKLNNLVIKQQCYKFINYISTMIEINNTDWFKFSFNINTITINNEPNIYPGDESNKLKHNIEFNLHFHKSLSKYMSNNSLIVPYLDSDLADDDTNINPKLCKSLDTLIKNIFSSVCPTINISSQIHTNVIMADYYEYNYFTGVLSYKPPLSMAYYKNNYNDLKPILPKYENDLVSFNTEENNEDFKAKINEYFISMGLNKVINMPLFNYQKRNIIWMAEIEDKVDTNSLYIDIDYLEHLNISNIMNKNDINTIQSHYEQISPILCNLSKYNIKFNDKECYYMSKFKDYTKNVSYDYINYNRGYYNNLDVINEVCTKSNPTRINLSGGILSDDVGLGKTLSTISHLVNMKGKDELNIKNDKNAYMLNNLIILPTRLLKQWAFEIEKYIGTEYFKITIIASITDIKKMYKVKKGSPISDKGITKYDIYLLSVNILNNNNYFKYIYDSWVNQEKVLKDNKCKTGYDINTYFDIFQIKWNRIIVDEVHESVSTLFDKEQYGYINIIKKPQRVITKNIIYNLQSNYRWGLTATPFHKKTYNGIGYIIWLSNIFKHNMQSSNIVNTLYKDEMYNFTTDDLLSYQIGDVLHYYIRKCEFQDFQFKCVSKTRKVDIETEINIPIVTEEIIPITLGKIEMNIYNSAKTQLYNHTLYYGSHVKRLFQLCTNICISEEDVINMGIDITKPISLEELNSAMIKTFTNTLNLEEKKLKTLTYKQSNHKLFSDIFKSVCTFISKLFDFKTQAYNDIYIHVKDAENVIKNGANILSTAWGKFYNYFKTELLNNIEQCNNDNTSKIYEIISHIMCVETDIVNNMKDSFTDTKLFILTYIILDNNIKKSSYNTLVKDIEVCNREIVRLNNQINLFQNNDFIKEKTQEPCPICWCDFEEDTNAIITKCRHVLCMGCFENIIGNKKDIPCPECRTLITKKDVHTINIGQITETEEAKQARILKDKADTQNKEPNNDIKIEWEEQCISKYGTKMSILIKYLKSIFLEVGEDGNNKNYRVIVFSQYEKMLKLIGKTLTEYNIKNVYAKGNVHVINKNIDAFKRDNSIRVIMLSSENSNSGSNLTEASHIIMVDVLNMNKHETKEVESQAIGRAVRLGQKKPVKVIRLITQNTVESVCYKKNNTP